MCNTKIHRMRETEKERERMIEQMGRGVAGEGMGEEEVGAFSARRELI